MFNVSLKGSLLREFLNSLAAVVYEAVWKIDENGIHVAAVELSNAILIKVDMLKEAFEEFVSDEMTEIAVDITNLNKFVKNIKGDDWVRMSVNDNRLILDSGTMRFDVALLDPTMVRRVPKVKEMSLPFKAYVDGKELERLFKTVSAMGKVITFDCRNGAPLTISAEGDTDKVVCEIPIVDDDSNEIKDVLCNFSTELLGYVIKAMKPFDKVRLSIGTDVPMYVEGSNDKLDVSCVIAPRVM